MFKKNIVKELRSAAGIVFAFGSISSFVAGFATIPISAIIENICNSFTRGDL